MTPSQRRIAAFGGCVSVHQARRVWAAVTRTPQKTIRNLADELYLHHSTVVAALRMLRDAGYIDFDPHTAGGRRVIVPFIVAPFVIEENAIIIYGKGAPEWET